VEGEPERQVRSTLRLFIESLKAVTQLLQGREWDQPIRLRRKHLSMREMILWILPRVSKADRLLWLGGSSPIRALLGLSHARGCHHQETEA
jgi:hypothetical protein